MSAGRTRNETPVTDAPSVVVYRYGLAPDPRTAASFRCPLCAARYRLRPGQGRSRDYDPKTQRFRCPSCSARMDLRLLATLVPPSKRIQARAQRILAAFHEQQRRKRLVG